MSRPGEVSPAPRGRRTLYLTIGAWYDRGGVHVTLPGWPGFHVNITRRNHPKLFTLLRAVLRHYHRWPESATVEGGTQ